jgi:hypothetical protein
MARPTDRTLGELGQLASQFFCDRLDAVVHQNDISVDHPTVVEHYRAARVTAARDERPDVAKEFRSRWDARSKRFRR